MNSESFAHVIRAAADVVQDEIVVVGSQAVLGSTDDPPQELLRSLEVDVYPSTEPERAAEIDGALGDGSQFHATYGYYAHGVGPETIVAPAGWESRLVRKAFPVIGRGRPPAVSLSLAWLDLIHAKLAAGRPHDLDFVEAALRAGMIDDDQFELGLELMPDSHRDDVRQRMDGLREKVLRATG